MKTYLVTGGAGFIGSNFIKSLLENREDIFVLNIDKLTYAGNLKNMAFAQKDPRCAFVQADIVDKEAVAHLFAQYPIDYVVHFAAESHVDRSIRNPDSFVWTNVLGTQILLECAKNAWGQKALSTGKRFLQISTDEVYGSLGQTGFFTEETPLFPRSPYSASKASADCMALSYYHTYGLPVNITRCSNNYGPAQYPEKLIPLTITNVLAGREIPVYGDGRQVRDWIYVKDHCEAVYQVLEYGKPGEIYNIGARCEKTNLEIIRTVLACMRTLGCSSAQESLIKHVTDRPGHDRRYGIDPRKAQEMLGWQARTTFETGILETVRWYLTAN